MSRSVNPFAGDRASGDGVPGLCAFAPIGAGPRVLFGLSPTGDLINIDAVPSGISKLVCPDCGSGLTARKGRVRVPHFAHTRGGECEHAGETALHKFAKDIIASSGGLSLPEVSYGSTTLRERTTVAFDTVEVEKWENGLRPDLIGSIAFPGNAKTSHARLIIEIRVSHRVGREKLDMLRARGESVLEIDLSGIDRTLSAEELSYAILKGAPREWLYHRAIERQAQKFRRTLDLQIKQKEARREYAIAAEQRRLNEQQQARSARPMNTTRADLRWMTRNRIKWKVLDKEILLDLEGDDSIFDVEPRVWKAYCLMLFAPWGTWIDGELPKRDLSRISAAIAKGLIDRQWVKTPFVGEMRQFKSGRLVTWHPVSSAVEQYMERVIDHVMAGQSLSRQVYDVTKRLGAVWGEYKTARMLMLAMHACANRKGATLLLYGREPNSETAVDEIYACAGKSMGSGVISHWTFRDILHEMQTGKPKRRDAISGMQLAGYGIEIMLPGDNAPGRTDRALRQIREA